MVNKSGEDFFFLSIQEILYANASIFLRACPLCST